VHVDVVAVTSIVFHVPLSVEEEIGNAQMGMTLS
jgi:hypothetical protein